MKYSVLLLFASLSLSAITFNVTNNESRDHVFGIFGQKQDWKKYIVPAHSSITVKPDATFIVTNMARTIWTEGEPRCYETYGGGSGWACQGTSHYDVQFYKPVGREIVELSMQDNGLIWNNSDIIAGRSIPTKPLPVIRTKTYGDWNKYQYIDPVKDDNWNN